MRGASRCRVKRDGEKMTDDCCLFTKNTLVIYPLQNSPLILRMIVLAIVMIFGTYICFFSSKQMDTFHNSLNLMKMEPWFKNRISVPVSVQPKPIDIIDNNPELMDLKPRFKNRILVPVSVHAKLVSAGSDRAELENKYPESTKMPWVSFGDPLLVQPKSVSVGSDQVGLEKKKLPSPQMPAQGSWEGEGEGEEGGRRRGGNEKEEEEMERRSESSRSRLVLGLSKTETNWPGLGPDQTGRDLEPWMELTEQHCHHHHHSIPQHDISYVHYPQPTTYRRNECACTPVRYFVILSMQRSGTRWLVSLLNSHVNISSYGEVFINEEMRSNISAITTTLDKVYNMDWFHSVFKDGCTTAIGFKWMLNQGPMVYHKELVEYFNRKGVLVIFLFRRNLLRRLVSAKSNKHAGDGKAFSGTHKAHVQSRNEADVLAKYKPRFNPKALIPKLRRMDKSIVDCLKNFESTRHIVLYYEDLIQDHKKLRLVQKFIGVPERDLTSPHVKVHTRPLSEQIANWDAVYTALKKTQYESFLDDDH